MSSGRDEHFRYSLFGTWSSKQTVAEQAIVARILEAPPPPEGPPANAALGWIRLIAMLPPAFRRALHAELVAGNAISGIESSDWPAPDSVIVYMQHRFTVARRSPLPVWRGGTLMIPTKQELEQKDEGRVFLATW